jgi:hypothetical protein
VADVPDHLVLKVARDREGRRDVVARPVLLSGLLVEHREPLAPNLRRDRITLEELAAQARINAQIAHVEDVEWAVLEASGQISFIPKSRS